MDREQKDSHGYIALGVLLVWPILYLCGAATTIQYADSAEFLTIASTGGVAHPPGYPLYTWLGWLAVKCWPGTVPMALAILAAALTWGTLVGIYATLRTLRCEPWAACLGASVAGVSFHIWKHATLPEVFALLGCQAAWLCYFACRATSADVSIVQQGRAWLGYALLAGLASAHHHTILFTWPVGAWLLWSLFRDKDIPRRAPLFVRGCGCFLLGLLPYLHLWWRGAADLVGSWGHLQSLDDVLGHFLRREFGTFQSGINTSDRSWWVHSWDYFIGALSWQGALPWGLGLLWVVGMLFVAVAWRRRRGKALPFALDGAVLALAAAWISTGLVFPILLKMGTTPLEQTIVARFYLLPDVFLGIFAGLGVAWLLTLCTTPTSRQIAIACLVVWIGAVAVWQFPRASAHKRQWLETYTRDMLRELPKGAFVLEARNEAVCFGMNYLQEVLGLRRDVRFVCVPLLARRWYVERLRKRWPEFRYTWRARHIYTLGLIEHYNRLGRPVHVTALYGRSMQRRFLWLPFGLSWRLLGAKEASPSPESLFKTMAMRYQKYRRPGPLPDPSHAPWEASVVERYAPPWLTLGAILKQMKRPHLAKQSVAKAKGWMLKSP